MGIICLVRSLFQVWPLRTFHVACFASWIIIWLFLACDWFCVNFLCRILIKLFIMCLICKYKMNTKIFSEIIPGDFRVLYVYVVASHLKNYHHLALINLRTLLQSHDVIRRVALTARLVFHLIFTHLLPLSEDRRDSCEVKILFKYAIFFR